MYMATQCVLVSLPCHHHQPPPDTHATAPSSFKEALAGQLLQAIQLHMKTTTTPSAHSDAHSEITKCVRGCGADMSNPQGPLQDFQVIRHAAVLEDVTDVLTRCSQKPEQR